MTGIGTNTVSEFQARLARFRPVYVDDWDGWLRTPENERPQMLGRILRKWQACRPNKMRRTIAERAHQPPFLEDLIAAAHPHLILLKGFELRNEASFSQANLAALEALWKIFENLSYDGARRSGRAGVVGISKAVLLLSNGRVGPAFDSRVKGHLETGNLDTSKNWILALRSANADISAFERSTGTTLQSASVEFSHLESGRLYDMALGPG